MWDYLIYCSVDERPLFMFCIAITCKGAFQLHLQLNQQWVMDAFFLFFLVAVNISTTIAFYE